MRKNIYYLMIVLACLFFSPSQGQVLSTATIGGASFPSQVIKFRSGIITIVQGRSMTIFTEPNTSLNIQIYDANQRIHYTQTTDRTEMIMIDMMDWHASLYKIIIADGERTAFYTESFILQ